MCRKCIKCIHYTGCTTTNLPNAYFFPLHFKRPPECCSTVWDGQVRTAWCLRQNPKYATSVDNKRNWIISNCLSVIQNKHRRLYIKHSVYLSCNGSIFKKHQSHTTQLEPLSSLHSSLVGNYEILLKNVVVLKNHNSKIRLIFWQK